MNGKPGAAPVAAVEERANRTKKCDGKQGFFIKGNAVNGMTFKELASVPFQFLVLLCCDLTAFAAFSESIL